MVREEFQVTVRGLFESVDDRGKVLLACRSLQPHSASPNRHSSALALAAAMEQCLATKSDGTVPCDQVWWNSAPRPRARVHSTNPPAFREPLHARRHVRAHGDALSPSANAVLGAEYPAGGIAHSVAPIRGTGSACESKAQGRSSDPGIFPQVVGSLRVVFEAVTACLHLPYQRRKFEE